jgi:hypothetical protein
MAESISCLLGNSRTGLPSISTMRSPALIPACAAGAPGSGHHLDVPLFVVKVDVDADAAELGFHRLVEFLEIFGADVVGIGIELFEHPLHRRLDELLAIDVLHVVAVDLLEGVDEHLHQLVVLFGGGLLVLLVGDGRCEPAKQHDARQQGDESITTHVTGSRSDGALGASDQTFPIDDSRRILVGWPNSR